MPLEGRVSLKFLRRDAPPSRRSYWFQVFLRYEEGGGGEDVLWTTFCMKFTNFQIKPSLKAVTVVRTILLQMNNAHSSCSAPFSTKNKRTANVAGRLTHLWVIERALFVVLVLSVLVCGLCLERIGGASGYSSLELKRKSKKFTTTASTFENRDTHGYVSGWPT